MAGKTQQLNKVTLTKSHTHAGIKYSAGDVIEVDNVTAAWLDENSITSGTTTSAKKEESE